MDHLPGDLPGEEAAMGTCPSRGLVRATGLIGVAVVVAGPREAGR